ncbi:hypothetical protein MA16_Dca021886 [Dendrobium catenatum]|uniref:Uncharacterized protein n=1 Tax=Dendrobium catenatum TaxID=906689 RepID=A0A2I0WHG9_9ASPA|nr:hypothetical protein MA16_Dca021886 [Dendrobium catenatum]
MDEAFGDCFSLRTPAPIPLLFLPIVLPLTHDLHSHIEAASFNPLLCLTPHSKLDVNSGRTSLSPDLTSSADPLPFPSGLPERERERERERPILPLSLLPDFASSDDLFLSENFACKQSSRSMVSPHKITALFWGSKRTAEQRELNPSLGTFTLTGSAREDVSGPGRRPQQLSVSVVSSLSDISSKDWDACAMDAAGPEKLNPFLTHAFLSSLEESKCAVKETGWLPQHVVAQDEFRNTLGVVPLYLKSHSYGEFVFDHSWADAYYGYGVQYYPKLQSCIPFTPVTGQRILVRNSWYKDQVFGILVQALKDLTEKFQVSSLHVTFPSESEWKQMKNFGFLQRIGMQYHWKNRNYKNFDEFLMDMKQSKRKTIRQERKKILAQNLKMKRLRGDEIKVTDGILFNMITAYDTHHSFCYFVIQFSHVMGLKWEKNIILPINGHGSECYAYAFCLGGKFHLFTHLGINRPWAGYNLVHKTAIYRWEKARPLQLALLCNLESHSRQAQGELILQRLYYPSSEYTCIWHIIPWFRPADRRHLTLFARQVLPVYKEGERTNSHSKGNAYDIPPDHCNIPYEQTEAVYLPRIPPHVHN